ncbi:phosphotriesterase-related protein [Rhodococcus sp. WS4]|nr:phosphotriesterase-related protein [Rhodococcus sp. WS4]
MGDVETMLGRVPAEELGFTLMHEHLLLRSENVHDQWPHLDDLDARADEVAVKVEQAYDAGVRTIVDVTTPNMTRDIPRLRRIAERTRVNIVCATGLHPHLPIPFFLKYDAPRFVTDPGRIADLFVRDLTVGYGDTGIKAGVIKVGCDPIMDEETRIVLKAAARAHRETGALITTHTKPKNKVGLAIQDVLEAEGVDLGRVVIGHSGDSQDFAYLTALCERGSFLGMDRFGLDAPGWFRLTVPQRIDVVVEMVERGFGDRMVLSHDSMSWCDFLPAEAQSELMPSSSLTTVSTVVVPELAKRIGSDTIRQMTIETPHRILARSTVA